jgi:hypothetical protein
MCADMVSAKKRELRVREDNPCRDVKAPERGARKAKQYLYPSEFLQFVSCEAFRFAGAERSHSPSTRTRATGSYGCSSGTTWSTA